MMVLIEVTQEQVDVVRNWIEQCKDNPDLMRLEGNQILRAVVEAAEVKIDGPGSIIRVTPYTHRGYHLVAMNDDQYRHYDQLVAHISQMEYALIVPDALSAIEAYRKRDPEALRLASARYAEWESVQARGGNDA